MLNGAVKADEVRVDDRTVRVRYHRGRTNRTYAGLWGRAPWQIAVRFGWTAVVVAFFLWLSPIVVHYYPTAGAIAAIGLWLVAVSCAAGVGLAMYDQFGRRQIVGRIVHRRRLEADIGAGPHYQYWVALDDGRHAVTRALLVDEATFVRCLPGTDVRAEVGPVFGHVFACVAVPVRTPGP